MRMTLPVRMPAAALLSVLLLGCGSEGQDDVEAVENSPTASDVTRPDTENGAAAADTMVTCGNGVAWPASAMAARPSHGQRGDLLAALERFAADRGPDLPPLLRDGTVDGEDWFELAGDGHGAAVATGPWSATGPGVDAQLILLENDGGWKVTSWGDCPRLTPFPTAGDGWVEITGVAGSRDTSTPTLLVNETACTGGRDPRPHLQEPTIVETADRVVVAWSTTAPGGVNTCIGNPPVPAEVTLEEPLGDRTLYDGSAYPPRKVG